MQTHTTQRRSFSPKSVQKIEQKLRRNSSNKKKHSFVADEVFKCQMASHNLYEVYISFGGLLMKVAGESTDLDKLVCDKRVFLLIRKIPA